MESTPIRLMIALLGGGAVFFLVRGVTSALERSKVPKVVQVQAMLAEEERLASRPTPAEQLRWWAASRGYTGALGPVVLALSVLYLVIGTVLAAVGLPSVVALFAALPCAWVVVNAAGGQLAARRKAQFDRQLLDALVMLSGQLESGTGIQRALRQVQLASPPPLRDEFAVALQQAEASRDLVGPMRRLAGRYPSRAFDLFIAALRIDEEIGGRIEPSLKEAAAIMQRDFTLAEEASAELAQVKAEFWGILVVIGLIGVTIVGAADPTTKEMYLSTRGLIVMALCAGWVGIGVLISLNLMRNAGGTRSAKLSRRRRSSEQERVG